MRCRQETYSGRYAYRAWDRASLTFAPPQSAEALPVPSFRPVSLGRNRLRADLPDDVPEVIRDQEGGSAIAIGADPATARVLVAGQEARQQVLRRS